MFLKILVVFNSECEALGLNDFPTAERLQWHGHVPETPDWSETSRFVAFTLVGNVIPHGSCILVRVKMGGSDWLGCRSKRVGLG